MASFVLSPLTLKTRIHRRTPSTSQKRRYVQARPRQARYALRMSIDPNLGYEADVTKELSGAVEDLKTRLKRCTVYLIGPMGSGKSVIGKFLASQLKFRYLDTDAIIEQVAKRSISEIFEDDGEAKFRDLESAVLDQVQAFLNCVVSTGGGIVMRDSNWGKLQTGIVIYLDVPIEVLVKRLENERDKRPLLKSGELQDTLQTIMNTRRVLYEQADVTVNVKENDAVDNVALEVCRKLSNFIKENPPKSAELYSAGIPSGGGGGGEK